MAITNIDCKIDGIGAMQLKSEFVKKAWRMHRRIAALGAGLVLVVVGLRKR